MPDISVVVPVYKAEPYLRRCLDSVLGQTFEDFELILVDDGSPDNSGEICDDYAKKDNRIRVLHQENQGQAAARNLALNWIFNNSDSEYISFVDSDDWIHPQYLELLKKAVDQGYGISACDFQVFIQIDEINNKERYSFISKEVNPEYIYTRGEKQIYTYIWGSLYEKSLWKEIRFPVGRRWEDLAVFHRVLFSVSKITFVDQRLYYYFQNSNGTVFSEWKPWKVDYILALEKLLKDPIIVERPDVFEVVQYVLIHSLSKRVFYLEKKKKDGSEYANDLDFHRNELQHFLIKYHQQFRFSQNKSLYSAAFPRIMWCYWTCVGVCNKIKRTLKKNV